MAPLTTKVTMEDGTILWLKPKFDYVQRQIFIHSPKYFYESHIVRWLERNISPGITVLEIGAHIGYYLGIICKKIYPGIAYFVEPSPENYLLLSKNISENIFANAVPLNVAISDVSQDVFLALNTDSGRNMVKIEGSKTNSSVKVKAYNFDDLLDELHLPKIDLMIMDIEGAEALAINRTQNSLKNHQIDCILLEFHPQQMRNEFNVPPREFLHRLVELGFYINSIDTQSGNEVPVNMETSDHYQHLILRSSVDI